MKGKTEDAKKLETVETAAETAPIAKKRGGRKPMSEKEKADAAKKRAEQKAKAASLTPTLILQYQGAEIDTATLIEAAKADYKAKKKRTPLTDLKLYLKPEERALYYVANEDIDGKIDF